MKQGADYPERLAELIAEQTGSDLATAQATVAAMQRGGWRIIRDPEAPSRDHVQFEDCLFSDEDEDDAKDEP